MKIVMNALTYKPNSSGVGIMIRGLFGKMSEICTRSCLVVLSKNSPEFPVGNSYVTQYRTAYRKEQNFLRIFFQSITIVKKFCKNAIFLTIDSKVPFVLPKSSLLLPIVTDLAIFRLPETYQLSRVIFWRIQYYFLIRRVQYYVAVSEFTKKEMTELLGISAEKIDVVHCAADEHIKRVVSPEILSEIRTKYQLPEKYLLFVGNYNPRKNLERLLLAFDSLKKNSNMSDYHLVIAGEHGWKFNKDSAVSKITCKDKVHFVGYIEDSDLPALYSMASLFIFPTLYEGFGIPILEAQQCGTPVVAGNNSAMPEVGGDSVVYIDVLDVDSITVGMKRVLEDEKLYQSLIEKGYENALRFSWERSAQKLNSIVERVCES